MDKEKKESSSLHDFNENNNESFFTGKTLVVFLVVLFFGVASGYLLGNNSSSKKNFLGNINTNSASIPKGTVVGSDDLKTFKDNAEGVLKEGGIEGEGQFHLVRPGGESQYVYLTSSLVDLSKFDGKKVKVWGQTNSAQKAGWLMDVGRLEVLE